MRKLVAPLLTLTLLYLLPPSGQAQHNFGNNNLRVAESKDGQRFALWLMPRQVLDATVTITGNLDNMQSTPALPCTFDISEQKFPATKATALVYGQPRSTSAPYHYDWKYNWRIGVRGGRADGTVYALPFQKGTSHVVAQSYGGTFSHFAGTEKEFAVDFRMPIGTTVRAARAGQVIAIKIDSNSGGMDQKQFEYAGNYVMIRHSDGTYASYLHLKQNGSLVRLGQMVSAGDAIALSGNTGMSQGPHLHFEVFIPIDGKSIKTIPVRFQTATGVLDRLVKGTTYTN
ncbi:M23 family metallopeptidase [bacterium]|nr:M23 family metallopeptidase [bacterium]MBP9809107.1 M23 family metallopeptidase [bacterium]